MDPIGIFLLAPTLTLISRRGPFAYYCRGPGNRLFPHIIGGNLGSGAKNNRAIQERDNLTCPFCTILIAGGRAIQERDNLCRRIVGHSDVGPWLE